MSGVAAETCRCCGGAFGHVVAVPSWRADGWPTFRYGECGDCGSLTLIDDVDPGPFYADYFSHRIRAAPAASAVRHALGVVAERVLLPRWPGASVSRLLRRPEWLAWFAGSGLSLRSPVLDVGSGAGALLRELRRWGFADLTGCDPFMAADTDLDGVTVLARHLAEVPRDDFGMVIFHHSLEHVDDPVAMLQAARARLASRSGRVVVAVPVAQGPAWHQYRDNWVGMDAPVHRFVPTIEGLHRLAERAHMEVRRLHPTSPAYHLVGSELVARRADPGGGGVGVLSTRELQALRRRAKSLRTAQRCPQVSAVLTVKP